MKNELNQYTRNQSFDQAMEANPNTLITLLLEAAIEKVSQAKQSHKNQQFAKKGFLLGRATAIIDGLRDRLGISLGQIAMEFDQFYNDIDASLQMAVEDDSDVLLTDIINALTEICNLWKDVVSEIEVEQIPFNPVVMQTEVAIAA